MSHLATNEPSLNRLQPRAGRPLAAAAAALLLLSGAGCSGGGGGGGGAGSAQAEKLFAAGEKALTANDPVQAMIAFKHARDLAPTEFKYHKGVWRALGRFIADNVDHVTVDNQEESRFEIGQLLEAEPQSGTWLAAMAHVAEHEGNKVEAARLLDEAVKVDPKNAVAQVARGNFLVRSGGKIDDALGAFQAAVAADPNNLGAHLGLGRLYVVKKDSAKEVEELTKAVALAPNNYAANEALGDAWLHAGKLVDAFKAYNKAAQIQPRNPEPHWGLGMIKAQAGKWAEAELELRTAMKGQRFPEMDFQLAQAVARQPGRCPEAIPLFQLFLREQPDHPAGLFEMASCQAALSRNDDAGNTYKRLIALPLPPEGDPRHDDALKRKQAAEANLAALQAPIGGKKK